MRRSGGVLEVWCRFAIGECDEEHEHRHERDAGLDAPYRRVLRFGLVELSEDESVVEACEDRPGA